VQRKEEDSPRRSRSSRRKRIIHHRGAEFAEFGVFHNQEIISPRALRLNGGVTDFLMTCDHGPLGILDCGFRIADCEFAMHHRVTELGVFLQQEFFSLRPRHLRGEIFRIRFKHKDTELAELGAFFEQKFLSSCTSCPSW
jgi:hypothetical protein